MSAMTRTQADHLLQLVNRTTGRRYRTLSQAARNFGMSGGALVRITDAQAEALIEDWSAKPEHVQPWAAESGQAQGAAVAGEGAMSAEQAAAVLGHEVVVTTVTAPDGITFTPDAVELMDDGRPALRARVALADITSWNVV